MFRTRITAPVTGSRNSPRFQMCFRWTKCVVVHSLSRTIAFTTQLLARCKTDLYLFRCRSCVQPQPVSPCASQPASDTTRCGVINDPAGPFGGCITAVGSALALAYNENCMLDACYSGDDSICQSIRNFATECALHGIVIPCTTWRPAAGCGLLSVCCL